MDNLTPEQRHKSMCNIKSKDTSIELKLRKKLWSKGYRFRKNSNTLPGKPDIVLPKYKLVIFCDGEFFHGYNWEEQRKRLQKTNNSEYWIKKISKNKEHDDKINKDLYFLGWKVLRFWGKEINKNIDECVRAVEEAIQEILQSKISEIE